MARHDTDILISGGGIAGLSAALGFGMAGFSVTLVSPAPPVTQGDMDGSDLRSTAFLQPAIALYQELGLWDDLLPDAISLDRLRIVDSTGWPPQIRDDREFSAQDLGEQSFGWNLLNWRVLQSLDKVLAAQPNIDLRFGTAFASMVTRESHVIARLSDGNSVRARLVIAADGRNSAVREAAGIKVQTTRYGQKALAFVAGHTHPHHNVSTEIYNEGGPLTLVPLGDIDGAPASAVVWMNPGARAQELAALDDTAFAAAMTERACGWLGPMVLKSRRNLWPIIAQRALSLSAQRTAIVAEAAHVVPPIGAQGLNTSLNDVIALRELAMERPEGLGDARMMQAYADRRARDIRLRVGAIDVFNRVTRSGGPQIQALRLAGLKAVHDIRPLRDAVMRIGMGGA